MSGVPPDDPFAGVPFFAELSKAMAARGPVQWDVARHVALVTVGAAQGEDNVDPLARAGFDALLPVAGRHVREAVVPLTGAFAAPKMEVVNRSGWVHHTLESYRGVFTEFARSVTGADGDGADAGDARSSAPAGADAFAALTRMLAPMMLGMSIGTMVGQLATRAFGQYDLPVPREPANRIILCARNVDGFAVEWSIPVPEMRTWVLCEELTRHAILGAAQVRGDLLAAITAHAAGFRPDASALADRMGGLADASSDPGALMQRLLGDPTMLLGASRTPAQERLAPRLEAMVAALLGCADLVVDGIAVRALGGAGRVAEAVRRRRVEAAASDRFVERLLGVRLQETALARGASWARGVVERGGIDGLARMFAAPGRLPTPAELDAPGLWLERISLG